MSESERIPGYRNRSHVPPIASRASRIANDLSGQFMRRWQPAPIPDRPPPTTRTSTCSLAIHRSFVCCRCLRQALMQPRAKLVRRVLLLRSPSPRHDYAGYGDAGQPGEADPLPRDPHQSLGYGDVMTGAVTLDTALESASTGDLWLFRGKSFADMAIRTFTNAPVNHVGMVVA